MIEKSVLILGVGNLLLADEGIGVHVAQRLQQMSLPPWVEVVDGGVGGFELIAHCSNRKKIILVDAVKTDAAPGTVLRFRAEEVPPTWPAAFSAHQFGLQEFLHFCQELVPAPEVIVYGVVPKATNRMSTHLSRTLQRRLTKLVALIVAEVQSEQ